jgi:hypothetical protein
MPEYCSELPHKCIPMNYLNDCFRHVGGGVIYWRHRPITHFPTGRVWFYFDRNIAGTQAFTHRDPNGYGKSTISYNGVRYILFQHRVVFALTQGRWPHLVIDHIDGNPRNNDPANLRDVSQAVNLLNRREKPSAVAA